MINQKMKSLGEKRSCIREIFEYGKTRKAEIGAENVFDFSLGNPSVPAPDIVNETLKKLIDNTPAASLHAYTSAQGDFSVRTAIADYMNKTYGDFASADLIYMTCGAAASLTISLTALTDAGDEVVVLTPFFPEYRVFVEKCGANLVEVVLDEEFQIDRKAFENAITNKTSVVIINSPNNPTGTILSEDSVRVISDVLRNKQKEFNKSIYILSDEPYRELSYEKAVPYIPAYYDNTVISYSFSKSLSLPGERIGYILVSSKAVNKTDVYSAVMGAGRALGFVCAPSLLGETADIGVYKENRDILYNALRDYGFEPIRPDGAFYIFMKSPTEYANEFCEKAKEFEILLVPSDDFGCTGYVRISYCVSKDQVINSLPAFKRLADFYKLTER